MSPAPYPPLHAGDDVDAAFFDQLGDELDEPADEGDPRKHQDVGLASLLEPRGSMGVLTSGAGTWSSPLKSDPEQGGVVENQEEGHSQDIELTDGFDESGIGTISAGDQLVSNGDDLHFFDQSLEGLVLEPSAKDHPLSNGDDRPTQPLETVPRVASSDLLVGSTSSSSVHPEVEKGAVSGAQVRAYDGSFTPPETTVGNGLVAEPNLSRQLSFGSISGSASITEEGQRGDVHRDRGGAISPVVSKPEVLTSKVQQVQWSNFGDQGGFASFSDFFLGFPADSSQQVGATSAASFSEATFHVPQDPPTSYIGSFLEHSDDSASFFDVQQPYERQSLNNKVTSELSTAGYEQLTSGEEQSTHLQSFGSVQLTQSEQGYWGSVQSHGQEQLAQSVDTGLNSQSQGQVQHWQLGEPDYSRWQEVAEYPGWLYNTYTQEWREKPINELGAITAPLADSSSRQSHGQGLPAENQSTQWQGEYAKFNTSLSAGQEGFSTLDQSTVLQSDWAGHQCMLGVTNITPTPASEETAEQQNVAAWELAKREDTGSQAQISWEEQYPGWYYDYQASEWKQYSKIPQVEIGSEHLPHDESEQSTSLPAVALDQQDAFNSLSRRYDQTEWPREQDQPYHAGANYSLDTHGRQDAGLASLQKDTQSSSHAQPLNHWGGGQLQFMIPSSNLDKESSTQEQPLGQWGSSQPEQFVVPSSNLNDHGFTQGQPLVQWGGGQPQQFMVPSSNLDRQQSSTQAQPPSNEWGGSQPQQYMNPPSIQESQSSIQPNRLNLWGGGQPQQVMNPSTSHQLGQGVSDGLNKQAESVTQNWDTPYSVLPAVSQVPPHQMPQHVEYMHYSTPQVPGYTPQPWSGMQSSMHQHFLPYGHAPQSPPKSMEEAMRTSAGRPPHVLISFGFGGKVVILKLKDIQRLQSSDDDQTSSGGQTFGLGPVHVHNLSQLVAQKAVIGRWESGSLYFGALGRSFSGPLVGGSLSSKELIRWLDDWAANCQSEMPNSRSPASLLILWGLLKLACKHYGKLRSVAGSAVIASQEEDGPEAALAQLLNSGGDQSSWAMGSLASPVCLQPMPSEHELQETAAETKNLLVAGKQKEALKLAKLGQLWGPALILARQLGEKYYMEAVAEMAQRQFLPGSPLRTLSLLLAGQPAEVFSGNNTLAPSPLGMSTEGGLGSMLDKWQENLSIMAANHTSGDDRVISHLGDCLWKVKGEVASAHICYLVADGNFESYSSSARLCLIGADHWKNPRTYASPEAIQRTEVYEYSKVLGNPQYILVSFQPYKLIYAEMLAEAGKSAEALKYCQAVLKTLKIASRSPEVEICRVAASSLEERLRGHSQGGHTVNLAPGTLVRGFLKAIDNRIHGIIGGPPPQEQGPMGVSDEQVTLQDHLVVTRHSPTWIPASLGPSASAEKINEPGPYMPQRSVSEPDFSATMKEKADQGKPITRGGYLGRFGSVFSKAGGIVSLVSKSSKNEAKLGEVNKFYYDENLKKWVEEGAAVPQEEAFPPPPLTSSTFSSQSEQSAPLEIPAGVGAGKSTAHLGTPPVPPTNLFSARTRQQGVRSRYVDTFNKGGSSTPAKSAISAFAPASKSGGTPLRPMNFFSPGASLDKSNGPILDPEKKSTVGYHEDVQVSAYPEPTSGLEDHMLSNQQFGLQNSFHQSAMVGPLVPRALSSENDVAFGTPSIPRILSSNFTPIVDAGEGTEKSGKLGVIPSKGDVGLSNGYHLRANSWSGYPSNFQMPQSENSFPNGNSSANFSMYSGFSTRSTGNTPLNVGSHFEPLPKVDICENPSNTSGMTSSFLSAPPSVTPSTSVSLGEFKPGAVGARQALVGDDLQEVEL